ncbi:MAG TPA: class I SAM-dependent methyltransferase [Myxococcota bacterium]|nr:class I SAM-dependent methyltransferase [Myxococcota bacterium]
MADDAEERPASRTALGVAVLRAIHQLRDGAPRVLDDPVAPALVGDAALARALADDGLYSSAAMRALRAHVVLRSRFAEDCIEAACRRGVRQLVVLGAGFDSFAYRQPPWAAALRIFEVDHPGSQRLKRERLAAGGVAIPENVSFVPADFERHSLREILGASRLDFAAPAVFSCLGVLVYLERGAIEALFRTVASFPKGSELIVTFTARERAPGTEARAAAGGEPWLTKLEPDELRALLVVAGFTSVEFLDPADAERRYFAGRSDGLSAPRRVSIARASV